MASRPTQVSIGSIVDPLQGLQSGFTKAGAIHDQWYKEKEEERKRSIVNDNMDNIMRGARADVMAQDKSALAQVSEDSGKIFDAAKQRLGADVSREDVLNSFVPGKEQTVREALMEKYHQSSYTPTQEEMQANITNRLVGLGLDYNDAVAQSELSTKNFLKRDVLQKEQQAKLDAERQSMIDRKEDLYKQANMLISIGKAEGNGSKSTSSKNSNKVTNTDFMPLIEKYINEGTWALGKDSLTDIGINKELTARRNMLAKTYGFSQADAIITQSLNDMADVNSGTILTDVKPTDIDAAVNKARKGFDPIKGGTGSSGARNAGRLAAAIELMEKADALDTRQRSVGNYEDARSKQFVDRSQRVLGLYGNPQAETAPTSTSSTSTPVTPAGSTPSTQTGSTPSTQTAPVSSQNTNSDQELKNLIKEFEAGKGAVPLRRPQDVTPQTASLQALKAWSEQNRKDDMYEAEDALKDPELSVFYDTQKVPNKADVLSYKEPSIERPAEVQEIIKNLERMDGPELRKLLSKTDKNILGMGFSVNDLQNASDEELRQMYATALWKSNVGSGLPAVLSRAANARINQAQMFGDFLGNMFSRASVDEQGNVIDSTPQEAEKRKKEAARENKVLSDMLESKRILRDYGKNGSLFSRLRSNFTKDTNDRDSFAESNNLKRADNSTPRKESNLVIKESPIDRLLTSGLEGNKPPRLPLPTEEEGRGFEFNDLFSRDIPSWGEDMNIGKEKLPFGTDAVNSSLGKTFTNLREGKKVVADLILANIKDFASGSSARKEWEAQANLAGEEVSRMIDNKAPANSIREFIAKEYKIFLPETIDFMEMDIDEIKRMLKEEGKIHL